MDIRVGRFFTGRLFVRRILVLGIFLLRWLLLGLFSLILSVSVAWTIKFRTIRFYILILAYDLLIINIFDRIAMGAEVNI